MSPDLGISTIPAALIADPRVGPCALAVYTQLLADPQATVADLVADADEGLAYSRPTPGVIRAALAELTDAGWLHDGRPVR